MEDIFEELAAAASDEEERVEANNQEPVADEAEEVTDETRRVVKPKRTVTRAPRPKLDPARLIGPRGIFVLSSTFDNVKFKGKGRELDDLNNILSRLQHWAHRLFPKMTFEDCIERIEELGHKKEIQVNMHKLRMGMVDLNDQQEHVMDDEEDRADSPNPPVVDAFDQLVSTAPAPVKQNTLTEEQRARMMRNRLLAEERRMARRVAREKELSEQRQTTSSDPKQNETLSTENLVNPESISIITDSASALLPETTVTVSTSEHPTTVLANSTNELHTATVLVGNPDDSGIKESMKPLDNVPCESQKHPLNIVGGISSDELPSAESMDIDNFQSPNDEPQASTVSP